MNKHGNLKCSSCGSKNMKMHVGYDGCDWLSKAGEGSGYDFGIDMVCEDCGRCYPICRLNNEFCVSELKELPSQGEEK